MGRVRECSNLAAIMNFEIGVGQTLPDHLPYLIPEDTYKNTFSYL